MHPAPGMLIGSPHDLPSLDPTLHGDRIVLGNSRGGFDQVQLRSDHDQGTSCEMALKFLPRDLSRFLCKFSTKFSAVHSGRIDKIESSSYKIRQTLGIGDHSSNRRKPIMTVGT